MRIDDQQEAPRPEGRLWAILGRLWCDKVLQYYKSCHKKFFTFAFRYSIVLFANVYPARP